MELQRMVKAELIAALEGERAESRTLRNNMSELSGNLSRTSAKLRRTEEMLETERTEHRSACKRGVELSDKLRVMDGTMALHKRWMTLLESVVERFPN